MVSTKKKKNKKRKSAADIILFFEYKDFFPLSFSSFYVLHGQDYIKAWGVDVFINGEKDKENFPEKKKNHFEIFFVSFVFTSHETVKEYNFEQLQYLLIDTLDRRERGFLFLYVWLRLGTWPVCVCRFASVSYSMLIRISRKNLIIVNNQGSQLLDNLVVFCCIHAFYNFICLRSRC